MEVMEKMWRWSWSISITDSSLIRIRSFARQESAYNTRHTLNGDTREGTGFSCVGSHRCRSMIPLLVVSLRFRCSRLGGGRLYKSKSTIVAVSFSVQQIQGSYS